MRFCRDCITKMVGVLSFSKDKNEKFNQCPKCYTETKHHSIKDKDLNFGEILDKKIKQRESR